jgi:hypothetical protein
MLRHCPNLSGLVIAVVFSLSCSENNLTSLDKSKPASDPFVVDTAEPEDTAAPEPPPEPPAGPPIGRTSVDVIDPGIVCGAFHREVHVLSLGESPLEIYEIRVVGEGWSASHPALPVTLAAGERFPVTVSSSGGMATLVVINSDPEHPALEVPLRVIADQPPMVTITSPVGGSVLSPGTDTIFVASVSDDVDASDGLSLEWVSDIDGVLGAGPASVEGVAELNWSGSSRSSGDHRVSLTAVDTCMQAQTVDVGFCQNEGYTEESIDLASWNFEGTALWDTTNDWVELTGPYTGQAGTAFQTTATVSSDAINIAFSFYVSGGSGADGISLTALDADRMTSFVGGTGGGIGYFGLPGWSVEIDTYYNSVHNDPTTGDHVSVHVDGDVAAPLVWAELPEMEDGAWHLGEVEVVGTHITVRIDGVTYIDAEVPALDAFPAYVGFTAATGAATNYHLIDALEVEGFVCED